MYGILCNKVFRKEKSICLLLDCVLFRLYNFRYVRNIEKWDLLDEFRFFFYLFRKLLLFLL